MNRLEQRRFTVLAEHARLALSATNSTKPITIVLAADELQNLVRFSDVGLFKDYSPEVRRRMARAGQALPDGSFPIQDCGDAKDAISSIGRADPTKRGKARSHIRKRVRALRCSGPPFEEWK